MGSAVTKAVVTWSALWLGIVGLLNFVVIPLFQPPSAPLITFFFYAACAIVGGYIYRINSLLDHHWPPRIQIGLWAALTALIFAGGYVIEHAFPLSAQRLQSIHQTRLTFPLFTWDTGLAKLADILFQQTFMLILIKELYRLGVDKKLTIRIFAVTFGAIHLPLVFMLQWTALYFIIPSFFAGLIFVYLIVTHKAGLFLSYAVHLIFYFVLSLWIRYGA